LDLYENDLDRDGTKAFWREDVAGLRFHKDLHLIDRNLARADGNPAREYESAEQPQPLRGYWYRQIRFVDENLKTLDGKRFALCGYPNRYGMDGNSTYIIKQDGVLFKKDLGHGNGIEIHPFDPVAEGWKRVE